MIDQNDKIIQELKNRPINENGSIHVARQNAYNDLIDQTKKEILNNKKILKFEKYVEWLENEVLHKTYQAEWNDNQRKFVEDRWIKTQQVDEVLTDLKEMGWLVEKAESRSGDI